MEKWTVADIGKKTALRQDYLPSNLEELLECLLNEESGGMQQLINAEKATKIGTTVSDFLLAQKEQLMDALDNNESNKVREILSKVQLEITTLLQAMREQKDRRRKMEASRVEQVLLAAPRGWVPISDILSDMRSDNAKRKKLTEKTVLSAIEQVRYELGNDEWGIYRMVVGATEKGKEIRYFSSNFLQKVRDTLGIEIEVATTDGSEQAVDLQVASAESIARHLALDVQLVKQQLGTLGIDPDQVSARFLNEPSLCVCIETPDSPATVIVLRSVPEEAASANRSAIGKIPTNTIEQTTYDSKLTFVNKAAKHLNVSPQLVEEILKPKDLAFQIIKITEQSLHYVIPGKRGIMLLEIAETRQMAMPGEKPDYTVIIDGQNFGMKTIRTLKPPYETTRNPKSTLGQRSTPKDYFEDDPR